MPVNVDAQNIMSAGLLETARSLRARLTAVRASCAEAASLMRRRRSCRSISFCICGLRYGRCGGFDRLRRTHDDATGYAHDRRTVGNVAHDQRVGGDLCSVAYLDLSYQGGACADVDSVAKDRRAFAAHRRSSDGYAMGDVAVAPDDCLRVDVNAADVSDVETAADRRLRVEAHLHDNF